MKTYNFVPTARVHSFRRKISGVPVNEYPESLIKVEPMLFSANMEFAKKKGGPLTKQFLDDIADHDDWIIDSRVHMLMKGFYPCIPGWHHDDVPRKIRNQPNYNDPEYLAEHRMMVVGKSAHTEFLKVPTTLPEIDYGTVYEEWDRIIEKKYSHPNNISTVCNGEIWEFSWQDFHRGVSADEFCWRYFIRASRNTKREYLNEVRSQVQVYLPCLTVGW